MPITHVWNGTILTITSDSGTSSADLKGEKGDDGCRGAQGAPGSSIATDAASLGGVAAAEYALKAYVESSIAEAEEATQAYTDSRVDALNIGNYATKEEVATLPTKEYVAAQIAAATPEIDFTPYATKVYVADEIQKHSTSAAKIYATKEDIEPLAATEYVDSTAAAIRAEADNKYALKETQTGARCAANLLDNSYWINPYNQRGETEYKTEGYTIDRWRNNGGIAITLSKKGAAITNGTTATQSIEQRIPLEIIKDGAAFTAAVKTTDGEIYCGSCDMTTAEQTVINPASFYVKISTGTNYGKFALYVRAGYTVEIEWLALYEGQFTAETLPPYVYKGYAAEMAECRRYYKKYDQITLSGWTNGDASIITLGFDMREMRTKPTITGVVNSGKGVSATGQGGVNIAAAKLTITGATANKAELQLSNTATDIGTSCPVAVRFNTLDISADL